jgi:hypothetical protein
MDLLDKRNNWILTYFFTDNEECKKQSFEEKINKKNGLISSFDNISDWELVDILLKEKKIKNVFLYKGKYLCCLERFVNEGYIERDRLYDYSIFDQDYFTKKFQVKRKDIIKVQPILDKRKGLLSRLFRPSLVAHDLRTKIEE